MDDVHPMLGHPDAPDGTGWFNSPNAAAMQPETYANPAVSSLLSQVGAAVARGFMAPGQALASTTPITSDQMIAPAMDIAGMTTLGAGAVPQEANTLNMGIKAYHGSPHDFNAFDLSKIGTGEGAQAYGHGLYFAENEKVAKGYREQLSPGYDLKVNGQEYNSYDPSHLAAMNMDTFGKRGKTRQEIADMLREDSHFGSRYSDAADLLQSGKPLPEFTRTPSGKMYEVNINADPEHFLDWDKPLSEQPHVYDKLSQLPQFQRHQAMVDSDRLVQIAKDNGVPPLVAIKVESELAKGVPLSDAITKVKGLSANPDWAAQTDKLQGLVGDRAVTTQTILPKEWTGSSIARNVNGMKPDEIADTLRNAGIPGIKYLDQGSRGAGDGSRNYVVFNDKLIDIMKKYAIPGMLAAPIFAGDKKS